jgi:hypothetical protein
MKKGFRILAILSLISVFALSGCAAGQLLGPTITPTPTATSTPIPTSTPTPTPTITPTPVPAILTNGSHNWPVKEVTFETTAPINNVDVPAGSGKVYLKVNFENPDHQILPFTNLPGTKSPNYANVYIEDDAGNEYIAVTDRLDLIFNAGGFVIGDEQVWFQAMPEGGSNFRLHFEALAPIDLNPTGSTSALPAASAIEATPTSTKIVKPRPVLDLLYMQDFENGEIGDWNNTSATPLEIRTENNNHYLHFTASGSAGWPGFWKNNTNIAEWKDYSFESKIRFYDKGVVLVFYSNNDDSYQGGLSFPDAVYFSDYVNGNYQHIESAAFSFLRNTWYTVRIEVKGDQLSMYVDDTLYLTVQRDTIPSGGIGFMTGDQYTGQFDVDDIKVWKTQ